MKILGYCITKGIKQKQSNHKEQFPSKARKFTLTLHSALCTLHSKFCPLFYFPLIISRSFCAFSNISPPFA